MGGLHLLGALVTLGNWFTMVDFKGAHFNVSIHLGHQTFLSFCLEGNLFQFVCLIPIWPSPSPENSDKGDETSTWFLPSNSVPKKVQSTIPLLKALRIPLKNICTWSISQDSQSTQTLHYITMVLCYLHSIDTYPYSHIGTHPLPVPFQSIK